MVGSVRRWTYRQCAGSPSIINGGGDCSNRHRRPARRISSLDLGTNLATHDPNLIVGPAARCSTRIPTGRAATSRSGWFEATLPDGVACQAAGDAGQLA